MRGTRFRILVVLTGGMLLCTGCTGDPEGSGSAIESAAESPAAAPQSASSAPTTTTPAISSSSEPSSSASAGSSVTAPLTVYYVALEDGGIAGEEIGCGDSLVATYTEPVTFTDQLGTTMERLLADDDMQHGASGLYNALYQSELVFEAGSVDGDTVSVELSGTITLGGTCDAPRVAAQLEQAAETATGTGSANIFLNDRPLEEALSSR